jgi:Capsular polysaccharide synthesis protein
MHIYTFWQDRGTKPAYLEMCLDTWYKNIPNLKVTVINHQNWADYVGDLYDLDKLASFSLPMQSDAVSAGVLLKFGGLFMDLDTIVTKDITQEFAKLAPKKLVAFGKPNHKGMHIAILKSSEPGNKLVSKWVESVQKRVEERPTSITWAYLGNEILTPLLKATENFEDYLLLDRAAYGNILEATLLKEGNPQADYYNLYFNENLVANPKEAADAAITGLISLHNSWTPEYYKDLQDKLEVIKQKVFLSKFLAYVLSGSVA